jgi:hypothetical protein
MVKRGKILRQKTVAVDLEGHELRLIGVSDDGADLRQRPQRHDRVGRRIALDQARVGQAKLKRDMRLLGPMLRMCKYEFSKYRRFCPQNMALRD